MPKAAPVWLQNMMRALASAIQLDLAHLDTTREREWTTKEQSIHGDCFVQYTYENNENAEYAVVTKGVDHLSHCVNRRYRFFTNVGGHTCNADPTMEHKFLKFLSKPEHAQDYASAMLQSYTPTEPLFSEATNRFYLLPTGGNGNYRIEKLFTFGNVIVQPFSEEGASYVAVANSTLTLKELKSISGDSITVADPETFTSLEYQFVEGDRTWQTPVDLKAREHLFRMGYYIDETQESLRQAFVYGLEAFVKELLTYKIQYHTADEIEKLHREGIQRLFPMFYTLDYESLKSLKDDFFKDKVGSQSITKRNIFTEMLSMAGTNPSAVLIKEMVKAKEFVSDVDAAKAITSVPFHIRQPNKDLVKLYEDLLDFSECCTDTFTKMAIPLAFSHLVRRTCELTTPHPYQKEVNANNKYAQEKRDCIDQLLNPYADRFFKKFESYQNEDHDELDHYMMVLYNLRWGKVYELLKPVAFGETKHKNNFAIRAQTIFAIASGAQEEGLVRETFMPIFLDSNENHEVRTAAFMVLVNGHVDSTMMSKITKAMIVERDSEVFNYVYTAFEKFAENWNEPCGTSLKEYATYFLKYWKQHMWMRPSYSFGISKTYGKVFTKEKYGYSGSVEVHTTGSHKSTTPLSIMFDIRAQHFGHHTMQVFGGYIRIQGLAKQLLEKVRQMTIFNPQQWKVDELKSILFNEMKIRERPDEPVNVDLILMFKDNVVFQRHYDELSVGPGGSLYQFFMDFVSLGQEYNINSQRGLMWGSILYEQPTELGVPLNFMAGYTTLASLQAKVTRGQDSGALLRTLDYKLQTHSQALHSLSVFNPANKNVFYISQDRAYNLRFRNKLTGVLNLAKSQMRLTWERPEFGEPMTFWMHSQTRLSTRSDKLGNQQTELATSCPTCLSDYVLTKGPAYKQERYFANTDNEEWGFHLEGKYFDCEAEEAKSYGQMFNVALEAFNPWTKQPHDLLTTVLMGVRQVQYFLLYYPKVESCGVGLAFSQSKYSPVDTVDITLTGQVKTIHTPNKVTNGKKFNLDGEIIFHGDVDRVHHLAIKYEFEPMMAKNELAVKLTRNPFRLSAQDYPAFSVCLDMNNRYPVDAQRSLLNLDFNTNQKVKADLSLSWGQHVACSNNPGRVQILGEHQTTEEGRKALKNKWYYKTCQEDKESVEWKNGATPYPPTKACYYTMRDLYTIYQYKWTANFDGLEPWMVTAYRKLETLVKTGLFAFWKIDLDNSLSKKNDFVYSTSDVDTYSPNIVVKQVFHPQEDTFDLLVQTNREKNVFKGVKLASWDWNTEPYVTYSSQNGLSLFTSLRNSHVSSFYTTLMRHNLISSCIANTRTVRYCARKKIFFFGLPTLFFD